jgi:hypothetical protein
MDREEGVGRTVTASEAEVLRVLFESATGSDEDRIRRSGLPRTTYLGAKKRLYERRLVKDAYLPNPLTFGFNMATFVLAQPFTEDFRMVMDTLCENQNTVLVWSGRTTIFGVMIHRTRADARRVLDPLTSRMEHRAITLEADLNLPTVPCYFDFEGVWNNMLGREGVVGYPRHLGGPVHWGLLGRRPTQSEVEAAGRLARRPVSPEDSGRAPHLMGPHTLTKSENRLIQRGWVQWRVFPSVSAFPSYSKQVVGDVVFMHGAFREGAKSADLFGELVQNCRTFPFLYCTDGKSVLIGSLSADRTSQRDQQAPGSRQPVASTLVRSLEAIDVTREPVMSLTAKVNHRYDRLFPSVKDDFPMSDSTEDL